MKTCWIVLFGVVSFVGCTPPPPATCPQTKAMCENLCASGQACEERTATCVPQERPDCPPGYYLYANGSCLSLVDAQSVYVGYMPSSTHAPTYIDGASAVLLQLRVDARRPFVIDEIVFRLHISRAGAASTWTSSPEHVTRHVRQCHVFTDNGMETEDGALRTLTSETDVVFSHTPFASTRLPENVFLKCLVRTDTRAFVQIGASLVSMTIRDEETGSTLDARQVAYGPRNQYLEDHVRVTSLSVEFSEGGLYQSPGTGIQYIVGGRRHAIHPSGVFTSWFGTRPPSNVSTVSDSSIARVPLGDNVLFRPGIPMRYASSDPRLFLTGTCGTLYPIDEIAAERLLGSGWEELVQNADEATVVSYQVRGWTDIDDLRLLEYQNRTLREEVLRINCD